MKKLLFPSLFILLIAASCTTSKSFMHQRYTSLGHKKSHSSVNANQAYARATTPAKKEAALPVAAEPVVLNTPVAKPAEVYTPAEPLTANAAVATAKTTNKAPALVNHTTLTNNGVTHFAKHNFSKLADNQVKQNSAKRGLLFGIINDLLSIILIIILVAVIVFLVLVLF